MNRVDLYQPEIDKSAMPAGGAFVFVEGRLCPWLEVVEIVQGGRGEYGSARLIYNPAADSQGDILSIEEIEAEIGMGRPVIIKWIYNALYPAGGAEGLVIFAGQAERIETKLGPDGETVEVTVLDYSAVLERISVFGRWVRDIEGRVVFLEGMATVFNGAGQANASDELTQHQGNTVRLFAAGETDSRLWNWADVISYLLCEYVQAGELSWPDETRLRAMTEGEVVRELDVTGRSLLDALEKCCEQAGLEFKFVPRLSENGPSQAIVFYRRGATGSVELNLQQSGERLSIAKTNVWKATSEKDFWPVTHRWTGQGDYKVFEATFELIKGWPWYGEELDYELYSPTTNPEFHKYRDVWRKWCLNEAGEYTDEPFTQGPAFDFSKIFGTTDYVHRRRRFWPTISCDSQGRSLGYFLEYSLDDGVHWWQYPCAFEILLDECGIWLASDRLDVKTWIAAIKNVLCFRITASVVSDQRLSCSIADGPVGSTVPVVEQVITAPSTFKYRKVTGASVLAGVRDDSMGEPDEVDDTAALMQFVRRRAQAQSAVIETFDVQTPYLGLGFEVGDIVTTRPEDRDIFSVRSDNRSTCTIERVRMDFTKQATRLKVVRSRMTAM